MLGQQRAKAALHWLTEAAKPPGTFQDNKSEREKHIPYANTYIWNLKKNGSDELRGRGGIKTQM